MLALSSVGLGESATAEDAAFREAIPGQGFGVDLRESPDAAFREAIPGQGFGVDLRESPATLVGVEATDEGVETLRLSLT